MRKKVARLPSSGRAVTSLSVMYLLMRIAGAGTIGASLARAQASLGRKLCERLLCSALEDGAP